jgi:hypothetical protein
MRYTLTILSVFIFFSCGKQQQFRISGELENSRGKTIYLDVLEVYGPRLVDSVKIGRDEKFSFSREITLPSFYQLRLDDRSTITLLAEPLERIAITGDASDLTGTWQVEGSPGSELLRTLNRRLAETRHRMDPLIRDIISLEEGPAAENEKIRLNEQLQEIINAQRRFSISFILENIESLAAITALYQQLDEESYVLGRFRDIQYLKITAESLRRLYPDSPHVMALAADAENQERQYDIFRLNAMAEEGGNVVTLYPDIAMQGKNGDTIRLKSIPEKYVLLLFGSSLDRTSVEFSNTLLPLYREYHRKGFQVYHVSVEQDRQEWLRYIEFSELPWLHVADLGGGNFLAAQSYNVRQIPTNYLIYSDMGIVARDISIPELRRRLSRALD